MPTTLPIHCTYLDTQKLDIELADQHVLKIISYGSQPNPHLSAGHHFVVNLETLESASTAEVWLSPEPVIHQNHNTISISMNRQVLCGHIMIDETQADSLEQSTQSAYDNIYTTLLDLDYPHLLRTWNYFPHINQHINSLERYQAFCVGRAHATEAANQENNQLPAASAIGTHQGPLLVYFIAAKQPGGQLENPIQTSAFQYPKIYSPRSPSFSRAMIKRWDDSTQLYISGTASVAGHQTMHKGDIEQQFTQTLKNLRALTDKNNGQIPSAFNFSNVLWKVYIRDPAHYSLLKDLVNKTLLPSKPVLYLHGDICRADLLMEIEGIYST